MSEEESQVMDLRDIMKLLEEEGSIPDGFVMIYMMADPEEAEDGTQTDFFFRAFAQKQDLQHKKTVVMWEDTPTTRHEIAWFGDWENMAEVAENAESEIIYNLERYFNDGTLTMMPRMDFMFVNEAPPEEQVAEDDVF